MCALHCLLLFFFAVGHAINRSVQRVTTLYPLHFSRMKDSDNNGNEEWQTVSTTQKQDRASRVTQIPEWFQTLAAPNEETTFEPFVFMLMGLPGSGKSTIAEKLQELEPWKYVRVNQDTLGDRKKCLKVAQRALSQNKCPIIDRCHVSFMNRNPFYEMAQSLNVPVDILIVDVPQAICMERCRRRQNHPTVSPNDAGWILGNMRKDWELPGGNEQARQIWTISGIEDPRFPELIRRLL